MEKTNIFQKALLVISVLFLIASLIFTRYKHFLEIGFYLPVAIFMFHSFINFFQLLNGPLKVIWIACIAGEIAVIVSLLIFPAYKVSDTATILILIFSITYNKIIKRRRSEIAKA